MTNILSIDGGGIRGIAPLQTLVQLEDKLGCQLYEKFNIFAGTSTGAIIAACLAYGIPAKDILTLYTGDSIKKIFNKNFFQKIGFHCPKYDATGIETVLKSIFGVTKIRQLKTNLVVPADDWSNRRGQIFSSFEYQDVQVWEAVRASTAAETYFQSYNGMFDGGLYANNPSDLALIDAIKYLKADFKNVNIISLGTGSLVKKLDKDKVSKLWYTDFIADGLILDEIMDRNVQKTHDLIERLPLNSYHRLQFDCPADLEAMDDISDGNIQKLLNLGEANANSIFKDDIDAIITNLKGVELCQQS